MGVLFWVLAVGGTIAAVYFWKKKKVLPAVISTILGAGGIFIIVCSFLLIGGID